MLIGGCCGGEYAPFQLKDTLPVGLGSLTFYGDEGLYANKTLPQQLHDALSGTGFRQLVHITLEQDTGFHAYSPHEEVRRVCEVNGVGYETRDSGYPGRYYSLVVCDESGRTKFSFRSSS